ncbi:MAG TPA: DUF3237 domain-containing protein [Steroidobacteraceae bacterium]|nr:DUF3237 domain-containing protein [Steroidobacteraceae bacterium]
MASSQVPALGTTPPPAATPRVQFAFEERVTLSPTVEIGETALGQRRYIPITGGSVAGPKLNGEVVPGGFDFQLTYTGSECTQLAADYFLKADDGTLIHVFNEGLACPKSGPALFRPRLEAPRGKHEWMTHATFVATLELEGTPPKVPAVRIHFFQVLID